MARPKPATQTLTGSATTFARRSKYKNVRTTYNGCVYDSKAEAHWAMMLDYEVSEGLIRGWIRQPTFRLGCHENVYRPDFLCFDKDGRAYCVDVKGVETAKFRRDKKLWKAHAPCELRIVRKSWVVEVISPNSLGRDGGDGGTQQ